ncbi:MAG: N-acetylmuramoyl-L-alanine amidase [Pseudomonadota bacterium]
MEVIPHPSPNFNARRHGCGPDLVVLHYTAMATAEAALTRLSDRVSEVSAHYLIAEDCRIWRLVAEEMRAWHAGRGAWGTVADVNSHSVGIELANPGDRPFPEAQMAALEALLSGVLCRWEIPPERVIAHSDLAPARKTDPGSRFDWRRLARAGLSIWVDEEMGAPVATVPDTAGQGDLTRTFEDAARRFGYRGDFDCVVRAFRLRFRPFARGALTSEDVGTMAALALRAPCRDPEGLAR